MKVKLIKAVNRAEYAATCEGICDLTGIIGELVDGYKPPAGKVTVAFKPSDLGYEEDEDDDPILLYIPRENLEDVQ